MKILFSVLVMTAMMLAMNSCGNDIVESGTYHGTVEQVKTSKNEIHVKTANGEKLDLDFTDATQLTRNGETVPYSALKKGQKEEVEVRKTGQRLEPLAIRIE